MVKEEERENEGIECWTLRKKDSHCPLTPNLRGRRDNDVIYL